ncbi:Auxin transport protein BIG [Seminavis robusta]|uniref:Auxin transport protein BIG n=1 Tax=Seminavis robusta TaxID=568900 RepID=A0A9N8HG20_9STRA|nr:Auxin transport protein BIG [Seminavis robusta]|eukprot:Sro461_g147810.1 Auxin transport protein BIG (2100) ;mRNA; r:43268-49976
MSSKRSGGSSHKSSSGSSSSNHVVTASPNSTRGVSLSLPLLEGLSQRPETAHCLVQTALKRLQAAQKIAHWVSSKWRAKKSQQITAASPCVIPYQQNLPSHQHWLWDAMRSVSRTERHVAARLLLQGGCPCSTCRTAAAATSSAAVGIVGSAGGVSKGDDEHAQWRLQQVLISLWNKHILPTTLAPRVEPMKDTTLATLPANIPMEWMALLKHIVLGKMVTEERIMAFCFGGIPWITQSIWQLVTALSNSKEGASAPLQLQALIGLVELCYSVLLVVFIEPETTTSSSRTATTASTENPPQASTSTSTNSSASTNAISAASSSNPRRPRLGRLASSSSRGGSTTANAATNSNRTATAETGDNSIDNSTNSDAVAKRLTLRRRVLQRLFWKNFDTAAVGPNQSAKHVHLYHLVNNAFPLSPLACLIGAFHIWKANSDWPYPGPTADACLTMLRQLVDPSTTAKAVSLAGLTAPISSNTGTTTANTRPREAPNSASSSSRQRRRKRQRSTSSASSSQPPVPQQRQPPQPPSSSGVATTFLFRSSAIGSSAAGVNSSNGNNNAASSSSARLAAVLGSARGNLLSASDDEDVEMDQDHDDDSEDSSEEVEEQEEEDEDEGEENNNDEEEDEELDQAEESLLHEDVARLEEGLLSLNDAAGPMEIDLEDIVGEDGGSSGLMAATTAARNRLRSAVSGASSGASLGGPNSNTSGAAKAATVDAQELTERKKLCLKACMEVLAVQHPPLLPFPGAQSNANKTVGSSRATSPVPNFRSGRSGLFSPSGGAPSGQSPATASSKCCFSLAAERSLLESAMGIVRPPKKPVNTKMIMRRAPTQEEFFRGSLSRNPISLSMLKPTSGSGPSNSGDVYEPTVRDLRQHIADDLQMSDSAELLELLVANKILDVNLKLRVVHQVLWKNHLMEHSHSAPASSSSSALASLLAGGGAGAPSFFSTGSGLSMMFSSGLGGISVGGGRGGAGVLSRAAGGSQVTADTPLSALPPLVVTYRLAGVDGEATEDTVSTLVDPEAPSDAMSPEEVEALMEKEYGITRIVTEGRGVYVLLRSIEHHIQEVLRCIRRDDISVMLEYGTDKNPCAVGKNKSRDKFKKQAPFPGLTLLRCCAKLPSNRKKLLQARAPTILLRLLLDVLNALEDPTAKAVAFDAGALDSNDSGSNETAEVLQELIEALASDISTTAVAATTTNTVDETKTDDTSSTTDSAAAAAEGQDHDATTLSLVLSSLETISLSPPLRNIIAKLLPFLTYGQVDLSRELAQNFARRIDVNLLTDEDRDEQVDGGSSDQENSGGVASAERGDSTKSSVLMDAFVEASISLPPNEVCCSLRSELINCGFIHRLASFITKGVPLSPPPWSVGLLPRDDPLKNNPGEKQRIIAAWREFFRRQGIKKAFSMLIGLCKDHAPTKAFVSQIGDDSDKLSSGGVSFLQACHWMEATSDNSSNRVHVRGVGLLAETLLDELAENDLVAKKVNALRRATRQRKKEIAQARRNKALKGMGSLGPLASTAATDANQKRDAAVDAPSSRSPSGGSVRETAASFLAPVLGFFGSGNAIDAASRSGTGGGAPAASRSSPRNNRKRTAQQPPEASKQPEAKKPAWMAEMENLVDEEGLVCSVCQEGRMLQPSELLGLYAYVKKVSIGADQCGSRDNIDGSTLLRTLPNSLPESLVGTHCAEQWFYPLRTGADLRERSAFSLGSSVSSRRNSYYTTTVSAGNAIHFSCHQRARQADRNHPKAPKSEWEGAILRNSRVNCNVILPLVSSRSSDVPLVAVDSALTEYQTAVNNLTGSAPKSMLWTVLHDVRFLLLRMAHGEMLGADCGGGSLSSNAQLLIHQLIIADTFSNQEKVETPENSEHVRNLSAGFLAACSIVHAPDYKKSGTSASSLLVRGLADSAPMAGLTCIVTHNTRDDFGGAESSSDSKPHPKRRWVTGRDMFLRGLIICAGRRHALGIETSGCVSGRGGTSSGQSRAGTTAFPDWSSSSQSESRTTASATSSSSHGGGRKAKKRSLKPDLDDFGTSLRPMICFFAILDQLSECFILNPKDTEIEESADKIVKILGQCQKAKGIRELLEICKASHLDEEEILEDFQRGLISA